MLDLSCYTPAHQAELEALLNSPQWRRAIESGLVDEVRAERLRPGAMRSFIDTVVAQLLHHNGERAAGLAAEGADADRLFEELARWPRGLNGEDAALSFVGLNLTPACNLQTCIYCNQQPVRNPAPIALWRRIIEEVTADVRDGPGPYIYLTGGEPLILGEELWGEDGLIRFATERGAVVNVNTNAIDLTPEVALRCIKAGLARLHISLDAADPSLQNELCGSDCFDRILEGIYNVQLARELAGAANPIIHTNCVLTRRNLDAFPRLFSFILEKHKQTADPEDPFFNDLFPHVIPVGGDSNAQLRPTEADFRRFYNSIWPAVCETWERYQDRFDVPPDKRRTLFGYFSNPFLRVQHTGGLDAYARASAQGRYGRLALSRHCYVAPTQAAFAPDGSQYRCGSHAIRRLMPIGHAADGVFENIRTARNDFLPQEELCYGCALATLYINQSVESKLHEQAELLAGGGTTPGAQAT